MADYDDTAAPMEADSTAAPEIAPAQKLAIIMQVPNIASVLPEDKLSTIATQVIEEYQIDKTSRQASGWEDAITEAMDLAMMVSEQKDYPFKKAANVKYPLLTVAALQFNARSYPAVVQGNRVAKCQTWGRDPDGSKAARADRVSEHLSYQLLTDPAWEEDTDKLLVVLPIVGSAFRKVWYDPSLKKTRSRLVSSSSLVVNYFARSMEDVPRATEEMRLYPYEIAERIRAKRFVEFDYANGGSEIPDEDAKESETPDPADKDAPQLFLEQHRLLDLDEDGYPEPYVVTVHHSSGKVVRIAANFGPESITIGDDGSVSAIRKQDYFIKYQFLPSPDGGFYGWGLGWLLKDTSEAINTVLNMILDAAHLSTVQGGLVSGMLGIKEKTFRLKPGEWKGVNATAGKLADSMVPIKYDGPSPVLFQLLGALIDSGKEVAAIKDVLTGDTPATAPVGTTLAIIEQGLQVFTSIYKRIHRSLKKELALHARLNKQHLDPETYNRFFDGQEQYSPQEDYGDQDMDIVPVSDPNSVSKMQKLGKAQFLREVATENPTLDQSKVTKRILEAAEIEDIDDLAAPPPDPEQEMLLKLAAMLELQEREAKIDKTRADTLKSETGAMKDVSDMAGAVEGNFIGRAKLMLDSMKAEQAAANQADKVALEAANGQGRLPAMEGEPGNAMGVPMAPGQGAADGAGFEGTPVPLNGVGPGGMASTPVQGGP